MKFHWCNLAASNLAVVFIIQILQCIKCRKPKENEDDNEQTNKMFVSVCFNLLSLDPRSSVVLIGWLRRTLPIPNA